MPSKAMFIYLTVWQVLEFIEQLGYEPGAPVLTLCSTAVLRTVEMREKLNTDALINIVVACHLNLASCYSLIVPCQWDDSLLHCNKVLRCVPPCPRRCGAGARPLNRSWAMHLDLYMFSHEI